MDIRPYRPDDLEALYRVAVATAAAGCDASANYQDPKLVGQVYAAPYAVFSPETVLVVDDDGVAGYIVGPADTAAFEALLEAEWWPALRARHPDPVDVPRSRWTRDQLMSHLIHHPYRTPPELTEPFPAHLHINLLPQLRRLGVGRQLMERWLDIVAAHGAKGAHLSTGAKNVRAVKFYLALGFRELAFSTPAFPGAVWFGIDLKPGSPRS